jgi:hypothetical protein
MKRQADDHSQLAGAIETALDLQALAARLAAAGLRVGIGESCHYQAGRYLRVQEGAPDFILEHVNGAEYLAHADANSVEQMYRSVSRLSWALAGLGIRHRFEVYDADSRVAHYVHHLWPG